MQNDEIKEILFLLHNDRLTESGKRKLEDYITNLKQENEKLLSENIAIKSVRNMVDETIYKSRCEKAVEYIKEHIRIDDEYPDYMEILVEEKDELLNILNGRSDE